MIVLFPLFSNEDGLVWISFVYCIYYRRGIYVKMTQKVTMEPIPVCFPNYDVVQQFSSAKGLTG